MGRTCIFEWKENKGKGYSMITWDAKTLRAIEGTDLWEELDKANFLHILKGSKPSEWAGTHLPFGASYKYMTLDRPQVELRAQLGGVSILMILKLNNDDEVYIKLSMNGGAKMKPEKLYELYEVQGIGSEVLHAIVD